MDTLPLEILVHIASYGENVWRGMLNVRSFASWSCTAAGKKTTDQFTKKYIVSDGIIIFMKGLTRHNVNSPTVVQNGQHRFELWFRDGVLDRNDGPAWIQTGKYRTFLPSTRKAGEFESKAEYYYKEGLLHRRDGPAISITVDERNMRYYAWYYEGFLHREGGPAIITDKIKIYYRDGSVHRDDGPAYIKSDVKIWAHDGFIDKTAGVIYKSYVTSLMIFPRDAIEKYNQHSHKTHSVKMLSEGTFLQTATCKGPAKIIAWIEKQKAHFCDEGASSITNGSHFVKLFDGLVHCDDGPAAHIGRTSYWCKYGLLHREDGPAIKNSTGEEWWYWGQRHRCDGPAEVKKKKNKYFRRGLERNDTSVLWPTDIFSQMEYPEILIRKDYRNSKPYTIFVENKSSKKFKF